MKAYELQQRIDTLLRVYRYTREHAGLTTGQRICLTLERVACMRALSKIKELGYTEAVPAYQVPDHLEQRIAFLEPKALQYEKHQEHAYKARLGYE